jgi:Fic family protein
LDITNLKRYPFTDGNGRTGRILNTLYLIEQNLLTLPILYLSHYIILHKNDYYKNLLNVTLLEDWETWIIYMLNAIEETSKWTSQKIKTIITLMEETRIYVKNNLPKIYTRELVDLLFMQPYCRISNVVDSGIAKRQAASEYLKKLADVNILQMREIGREKIFVNPRVMQIFLKDTNNYQLF